MFICGILKFSLNYKFLLINLLTLEFIVLILFINLFIYLNLLKIEIFFIIIFITLSVCEGVLGISLLIIIIRNYNNNYFQSLRIFIC